MKFSDFFYGDSALAPFFQVFTYGVYMAIRFNILMYCQVDAAPKINSDIWIILSVLH